MKLKTKSMSIAALVAAFVFPASALEYNDGVLTWRYFPLDGSTTEARLGDGTNACVAASVEGEITLPGKIGAYTVTTVSANAFKGCSKIAGVSILENIDYIDEGAFDGATALKRISVINRNENFFSYKGVLYSGDFLDAELVRVPAGFDADEFDGLVEPHVWYVCPDAFNGCANIKRIKVDSMSAESLGDCLFSGCTGFTEFVWDEDEWDEGYDYFCVKDGVLYDCNCRGLVKWPSAKPIAGFEGLKLNDFAEFNVREGAFAGNSMESVSIPDGVSIEANAFVGCANLKTVSFLGRVDQQCGVLDSAEDAGLNLEKVIYPGFPKDKSDEWRDEIDRFKETYPESKIVFEKAEDPNAGKTNITIPYTERHDILWKYDFESYAKDLTTITFDGPCPDDFGDILAVCTNVAKIVYSANPIYRDADYDWESWKIVMSRDWGNELPGRRITFEEGAIPSETQFCFEDPEYRDCLSGIWYYDEALDCEVCLSPIWPVAGELRIPDGVYELGEGALCGLDQVTKLVLPQMMAWGEISDDVGFETMTNLVEIEVEGGRTSFCNDCYYSVDGCLYSDGRLVRVPPAYDADELVIVGEDCPESNALVGCRNIRKLTAGNCDLLECVLSELDLTGCDQLVEFGCRESKWESLSDYGYAIIDGAIYDGDRYFGDWEEWERKLLMWPNGKRPIEFANGTTEVDPEVFRYLAHPEAITELTLPERCKDFDLYALADEYGFTNVTRIVCQGYPWALSTDLPEVMPKLAEIVHNPCPWYGWGEFIAEFKAEHPESTVAFVEMPVPEEPIYECDPVDEGICYIGDGVYPFVYPSPKGAYEVPEEIKGLRVVAAYENAFANMDELTEVTFPASFVWLEAGVQTNKLNRKTGENIPIDPPRYYSPFVGCTSLSKLVFKGRCPDGLCEALEQTPSVVEVDYIDIPWYGWGEFIAEFKSDHPESTVAFVEMPTPEGPIYNCEFDSYWDDYDNVVGECYLGDGDYPFVYPSPKGAYEVPEEINGCRVVKANENAFADMGELTEVTFPTSFEYLQAGTHTVFGWGEDGERVPIREIHYSSPFVGCASLTKLVFKGRCPDGLCETLEQTPSVVEVDYIDIPWYGWGEFIADFKAEHPESPVVFNAMPTPEEPIYNCQFDFWWDDYDNVVGECYLGDGDYPFVYPSPKGAYEVPEEINGYRVVEAYENAFVNMDELTEVTFPASFWCLDAGTSSFGYWHPYPDIFGIIYPGFSRDP